MGNKRKLSVDYLNIVFKFETMVKRAILSVIDLPRVFGLGIWSDLDGAGGVYGYES